MSKYKLSILITTKDSGITKILENFGHIFTKVYEVIISHQISDNREYIIPIFPENVKYFGHKNEVGLSRNRNFAIKQASGDICHICDDDLFFLKNFEKIIEKTYQEYNADVITFGALDGTNKNAYFFHEGPHNERIIANIFSWGITFNREKILQNNIFFDENFGLGTEIPIGEENIFLKNISKKKLKTFHTNIPIVKHSKISTGFKYSEKIIFAKMQVYKKMYGYFFSILLIFNMSIKHFHLYKNKFSFLEFIQKNFIALFSNPEDAKNFH